jgi:hypothetical protein
METRNALGLHRIFGVVRNYQEEDQELLTDLDFVMGFRDPPRRFPMPAPTHEER